MRFFKTLALAAALGLAACGEPNGALKPVKTTEAQLDKLVTELSTESYKGKDKIATDVASVTAALPKSVSVTWASLDFEAASGATVLKTVKVSPADNAAIGVSIDTLKLWDFDAGLAKARLSGQRLTETAPLASRIDATGIRVFGLETLMKPAMDAYTGAVVDAATGITGEVDPALQQAMQMQVTKYDFSAGRLIIDDLVLRPYEIKPLQLPADNDFAQVMPVLQGFAAVNRSLAFNTVAYIDMKGDITFSQGGVESAMTMGIERIAMRGVRGGDSDLSVISNMSYDMDIAVPATETVIVDPSDPTAPPPAAAPTPPRIAMKQSIARAVTSGMRLDKVMGYLARGQMPPRSEADLLSLGVARVDDMKVAISGAPLYSMETMTLDLSQWHWFVPNAGRIEFSNFVYDVGGIVQFVQTTAASIDPNDPALAQFQVPPGLMQTLAKYGLDKPSFDSALGWNWNTTSGKTVIDLSGGLDAYTRMDMKVDLTLPGFKPVSDLIPETGGAADEAKLEELFRKTFRFNSAEANFADEGGFEKGFAAASELAKYLPADAPELETFKNLSAQQLRGMASSGAYLLADTAAQQVPATKELLRPFAAWITDGGKVRVAAKPKTPLGVAELEKDAASPEAAIALFGLTVTHTPGPKPKS